MDPKALLSSGTYYVLQISLARSPRTGCSRSERTTSPYRASTKIPALGGVAKRFRRRRGPIPPTKALLGTSGNFGRS